MENWKDVIGYKGVYQVSDLGNVKSLSRIVKFNSGLGKTKERILKCNNFTGQYSLVSLCKENIKETKFIHILVAIAFLNHKPCGMELVINHIDFNKLNNRADNLEIVTSRVNCNKKHIKSSSKYTGVYWNKNNNKWRSCIKINGKTKHLGCFINQYDAYLAYEEELNKITC